MIDGTSDATELAALQEEFIRDKYPILKSLTEPALELKFNDGITTEKTLIVAPIFLSLNDESVDSERTFCFYLGLVPKDESVDVKVFMLEDLKYYGAIFVTLIVSLLLSTYCVFQTSHTVIKPLRILNMRMNEILQEDNYDAVSLDSSSG